MDRRAIAQGLEEWMATGYAHFQDTGRHKRGRHLLKSYLVEANASEVAEDPQHGVRTFFERDEFPLPIQVALTDDPTFHRLAVGSDGEQVEFFLDTLNPRFWILHTIARADAADAKVRSLVHRSRLLDACWLPSRQLVDWTGELGVQRSLTAKFSLATRLYQEAIPEEEFLSDSLLLRVGARGSVRNQWAEYQATQALAPYLALWSARVARRLTDTEITTITDVTAAGKVTSRGDSFRLHEQLLIGLLNRYARMIEDWEERYRLNWVEVGPSVRPTGTTAVLQFPEPMDETRFEDVLGLMFACSEPFRLYGVPVRRSSGRYVIRGIDLHTGDKIDFEFTPEFIRAYLFPSTCGNVLARLLTNLQHYVDARIELA